MASSLKVKFLNQAFKVLHHMGPAYFSHSLLLSLCVLPYQSHKTSKQAILFFMFVNLYITGVFFCNIPLLYPHLLSVILQEVTQILLPLKRFHQFLSYILNPRASLDVTPYHTLSLALFHSMSSYVIASSQCMLTIDQYNFIKILLIFLDNMCLGLGTYQLCIFEIHKNV